MDMPFCPIISEVEACRWGSSVWPGDRVAGGAVCEGARGRRVAGVLFMRGPGFGGRGGVQGSRVPHCSLEALRLWGRKVSRDGRNRGLRSGVSLMVHACLGSTDVLRRC